MYTMEEKIDIDRRKILGGSRKCGKTQYLLRESAAKQKVIVTLNDDCVRALKYEAEKLGIKIPTPISIEKIQRQGIRFRGGEVLVDEIELVLERVLGARIVEATTSSLFEALNLVEQEEVTSSNESRGSYINVNVDIERIKDAISNGKLSLNKARSLVGLAPIDGGECAMLKQDVHKDFSEAEVIKDNKAINIEKTIMNAIDNMRVVTNQEGEIVRLSRVEYRRVTSLDAIQHLLNGEVLRDLWDASEYKLDRDTRSIMVKRYDQNKWELCSEFSLKARYLIVEK